MLVPTGPAKHTAHHKFVQKIGMLVPSDLKQCFSVYVCVRVCRDVCVCHSVHLLVCLFLAHAYVAQKQLSYLLVCVCVYVFEKILAFLTYTDAKRVIVYLHGKYFDFV